MVLDRFHRRNHMWCLEHMPEVDPQSACNEKFVAEKNTESCEQLNLSIAGRTKSVLEATPGRFAMFWGTLLIEHKEHLDFKKDNNPSRRHTRQGLSKQANAKKQITLH